MPRVNFITFLVVSVFVLNFARGFAAETNAATELVTAIAKLHGATYRKRDQMQGAAAKARLTAPVVTEYSGDRSRVVTEMNLPRFGLLRQERVTVGKRTAVRTTSSAAALGISLNSMVPSEVGAPLSERAGLWAWRRGALRCRTTRSESEFHLRKNRPAQSRRKVI